MSGKEFLSEPGPKDPVASRIAAKLYGEPAAAEEPQVRYHVEVQRYPEAAWTRPNVGGIEGGFPTPEEAEHLISVLRQIDGEYYAGQSFQIVKVTREVVTREQRKVTR